MDLPSLGSWFRNGGGSWQRKRWRGRRGSLITSVSRGRVQNRALISGCLWLFLLLCLLCSSLKVQLKPPLAEETCSDLPPPSVSPPPPAPAAQLSADTDLAQVWHLVRPSSLPNHQPLTPWEERVVWPMPSASTPAPTSTQQAAGSPECLDANSNGTKCLRTWHFSLLMYSQSGLFFFFNSEFWEIEGER